MLEAGLLRGWPGAERAAQDRVSPGAALLAYFWGQTSLGGALTERVNVAKLPWRPNYFPCDISSTSLNPHASLFVTNADNGMF